MAKNEKSPNIIVASGNKVVGYFIELKREVNKMTWPSKKAVKKAVIAVATFCLIYIVIIAAFDYVFKNIYNLVFKSAI